jgi:hypothetical protein
MNGILMKKFQVTCFDEESKEKIKKFVTDFETHVRFEDKELTLSWTSYLSGCSMENMIAKWKRNGLLTFSQVTYYPKKVVSKI